MLGLGAFRMVVVVLTHDQLIDAATEAAMHLKLVFEISRLLSIQQWQAGNNPVLYLTSDRVAWVAEVQPVRRMLILDGPVIVVLLDEFGAVISHQIGR